MKTNLKFILLFSLSMNIFFVKAQNIVASLNFDGYIGTVATVPAGYYISWNSTSTNSFYTSAGNFGINPPSYKFVNDGAFIITPYLPAIDSLTFFGKGNGSPFSPLNELRISHSTDSINWTSDTVLVSMSASGTIYSIPVNQSSGYFRFEYYKASGGGNLAFDDLLMYSNQPVSVNELKAEDLINVYPTPSTGLIKLKISDPDEELTKIDVFDLLGNKVSNVKIEKKSQGFYTVDLTGKNTGFYFLKIQTTGLFITKRITLVEG